MVNKPELGLWGEDAVIADIRRVGGLARNANVSVRPNCPVIDVIARLNGARVLIQVRTTGTPKKADFITPPQACHALEDLATRRKAHGLWAFVYRVGDEAIIRYAPASTVTTLAEQWEAEYLLTHDNPPLYHTNIHGWDITIDRISEILN
jgi:hypothetical protein